MKWYRTLGSDGGQTSVQQAQAELSRRIELNGEYDLSQKERVAALFRSLRADGPAIIDLTKVTFIDSTFLHELAALRFRFKEQPITLIGASANVKRLLRLVKFERLFKIAE